MRIRWIDPTGVRDISPDQLPERLAGDDGWAWVDVPRLDRPAEETLRLLGDFHPRALDDLRRRNHVPKVHVYGDHVLLVLHAPKVGDGGHVHYLELDQLVGSRYLVTVHGPSNPEVPLEDCLRETDEVGHRTDAGRLRPASPLMLSYAIVSTLVRHEEQYTADLAYEVGLLEQRVMSGADEDPEAFLDRLYQARHRLLTVRTMAAQSEEIFGRAARLTTFATETERRSLKDALDQYRRVSRITDGQLAFLQGVTEYYRARTDTKMTIAAERLAVIAALTLPITAVSSVMGMNVIVNGSTRWTGLIGLLTVMSVMSLWLLRWAKRHGWW